MGKKKSKGELLYEQASYNEFQKQVSYDNSESIRALHRQGADLEVQYRYLIDWLFEFLVN